MGLMMLGRHVHTAEPLMPEPRACEVELAIEKLKSHKSQGTDQIPAVSIKAGGRTIWYEIHKLINSIWRRNSLTGGRSQSLYLFIRRVKKNRL
jgi:hypothetical protein